MEYSPIPSRRAAVVVKRVGSDRLALRFTNIGGRQRFNLMLQRLRFDFPLASYEELAAQPWWIIAVSQRDALIAFCKRNGLTLIEES